MVDWNDALAMLAEAAGRLPRGIEKVYLEIEKLDHATLANGSIPLMELLIRVSWSIARSYPSQDE